MSAPLVTREDAITAMRVLSTLAAHCAVTASELAIRAAQLDPQQPPAEQHPTRAAGTMEGARFAADRAATLGAAVTIIAQEVFNP